MSYNSKVPFIGHFFRFFFSIYALAVFMPTFVIVFILYYIVFNFWPKEKMVRSAHRITRFWSQLVCALFFLRLKLHGEELVDPHKTYVIVCNHRSQLDVVVAPRLTHNIFRFLAKAELFKLPVIGYVLKRLYIGVRRDSKEARKQSMEAMKSSLNEGVSVFLYPEGTRNTSEEYLSGFYDGAFSLAIEAQVPLAICTILGSEYLLSPRRFMDFSPGTVTAVWDQPIDTIGMGEEDVEKLKERTRETMIRRIREYQE